MTRVTIYQENIELLKRQIQEGLDKSGPLTVLIAADESAVPADLRGGQTTNYYGPVFHASADGAQLAWGNDTVHQNRNEVQQIAPGFEDLARVVASLLEQLPTAGLPAEDQQAAEEAVTEVLAEVVQAEPDRGKIRRSVAMLKGFLSPVAIAAGSSAAQVWTKAAIEQLGAAI